MFFNSETVFFNSVWLDYYSMVFRTIQALRLVFDPAALRSHLKIGRALSGDEFCVAGLIRWLLNNPAWLADPARDTG
jgi:hypothetical protein